MELFSLEAAPVSVNKNTFFEATPVNVNIQYIWRLPLSKLMSTINDLDF